MYASSTRCVRNCWTGWISPAGSAEPCALLPAFTLSSASFPFTRPVGLHLFDLVVPTEGWFFVGRSLFLSLHFFLLLVHVISRYPRHASPRPARRCRYGRGLHQLNILPKAPSRSART